MGEFHERGKSIVPIYMAKESLDQILEYKNVESYASMWGDEEKVFPIELKEKLLKVLDEEEYTYLVEHCGLGLGSRQISDKHSTYRNRVRRKLASAKAKVKKHFGTQL